jgi:cytochrome b involved in lipid metabolism
MGECALFLSGLANNPPLEGHLSVRHGFLSPSPQPERLPSEYEPWDEMARALPELFFSNRTKQLIEHLPVLSAKEDGLPSEYLTRASMVLSALGHAYWRFGAETFYVERTTQVPTALPAPLLQPWQEVSRRLGRWLPDRPFQTFYDLFLHNYRISAHAGADSPALIQNIELMVPSFGSETERIFYGAFIEMHVHFAPVVATLCELEDAVKEDRVDDVVSALATIEQSFRNASKVWAKIGPRPGAQFYCDPVIWAKTVAILGVPPALCPQGGTSGACAPIIYLLDALLGRQRYESYYGQYVRNDAGPMVPQSVHDFARAVSRIELMGYVAARADSAGGALLDAAIRSLLDAYVGPTGWLGRHASKAFNYLCVSTITGRNASVSGHERYFSRQTWERAAQNLHASRVERNLEAVQERRAPASAVHARLEPPQKSGCPFLAASPDGPRTRSESAAPSSTATRRIARSELSKHINEGDLWVAIDATVYDVSAYGERHPGGPTILFAYAGRDVSAAFWQQYLHHTDVVRGLLARFAIGQLTPLPEAAADPGSSGKIHEHLLTLLRGRQAARLQHRHDMGGDARMKMFSDEHGHLQLWCDVLPAALEHLAPGLAQRVTSTPNARSVLERAQWLSTWCDFRGALSPSLRCAMARRSASLRLHDLRLLDQLLELAGGAVERLEGGANADDLVEPLIVAATSSIARYFDQMAQDCDAQIRALGESLPGRQLRLDLERLSAAG